MAYLSHFCIRKKSGTQSFRIKNSQNLPGSFVSFSQRDAYWLVGTALVTGLSIAAVLIVPRVAFAFWGFFTPAAGAEPQFPLHDDSLGLLAAATNIDPNPYKGSQEIETTEGAALMANVGPDGTVTGVYSTKSTSISLYTVREGDTLSEIAEMNGVSVNTILWANEIKDASTIQPGDTLLILPVSGVRYTIKRGGTLQDVAKLFDADVDEIALFNGISPNETLAAGTELIVPGGNLAPVKKSTTTRVASSGGTRAAAALPDGHFANPLSGSYVSQGIHGTNGIDLAGMPMGSAVHAAADGTVIVAKGGGGYNGGYGNYIVIDHGDGTQTLYAHLSSVSVGVGSSVSQGQTIGGVGNTGRSTGIHLHFEVRGAKNPFAH